MNSVVKFVTPLNYGIELIILGMTGLRLYYCNEDGTLQENNIDFAVESISFRDNEEEQMCFTFDYCENESDTKQIKIYTPYVSNYLNICI